MAKTSPASWTVAEVEADKSWVYRLSDAEDAELLAAVRRAGDPGRPILDWRRDDFALSQSIPTLAAAFREVRDGRGMAMVRNLPREGVTPAEFRLMTWAMGCISASPGRRIGPATTSPRSRIPASPTAARPGAATTRTPSSTSMSTAPTSCCSAATTRRRSAA